MNGLTDSAPLDRLATMTHLFVQAELVLDTPLHVGSGDTVSSDGVLSTLRDASGSPTIPGSSLAGVFVEEASNIMREEQNELWRYLTGKRRAALRSETRPESDSTVDDFLASAFEFSSLPLLHADHLPDEPCTHVRDMVKLRAMTRTPEHGAKFAAEVIDPGLRFQVLVQCRLREIPQRLRQNAVAVLNAVFCDSWGGEEGCGFIGGGSARGLGWFHLESARVAAVDSPESMRRYLDASSDSEWVKDQAAAEPLELRDLVQTSAPHRRTRKRWQTTLTPRSEPEGYGRWPVLIRDARNADDEDTDFVFTSCRYWQYDPDGSKWTFERKPVIPGSSWRGAARAFLSSLARSGATTVSEDVILRLFSDASGASAVKFSDAYLVCTCESMKVERLALDEMTRAAYAAAKFNDKPIFEGSFLGTIVLTEAEEEESCRTLLRTLRSWGGEDAPWIGLGAKASPVLWELNA